MLIKTELREKKKGRYVELNVVQTLEKTTVFFEDIIIFTTTELLDVEQVLVIVKEKMLKLGLIRK